MLSKLMYDFIKMYDKDNGKTFDPIEHLRQNTDIEVTVDIDGNFIKAVCEPLNILIPVTEHSAGRGSDETAHPLTDKLDYCAGYETSLSKYLLYSELLSKFALKSNNCLVKAVSAYVLKKTLLNDLNGISPVKSMFVRWVVRTSDGTDIRLWMDEEVRLKWIETYHQMIDADKTFSRGMCMVTGKKNCVLTSKFPKKIYAPWPSAKLISSMGASENVFTGDFFKTNEEAVTVSREAVQKAFSVLRYLVSKQSRAFSENRILVIWNNNLKKLPNIYSGTGDLKSVFNSTDSEPEGFEANETDGVKNTADYQSQVEFFVKSYANNLTVNDTICILSLESYTPGKMSIGYYAEGTAQTILNNIAEWYKNYSWFNNAYVETIQDEDGNNKYIFKEYVGAPSLKLISDTFSLGSSQKGFSYNPVCKDMVQAIYTGSKIPYAVVEGLLAKTVNPLKYKKTIYGAEYKKYEAAACAMYRGYYKERNYKMYLEEERTSRSYLYGRMLAVAHNIELFCNKQSHNERNVTAAITFREMLVQCPHIGWMDIENKLNCYREKLMKKNIAFIVSRQKLLDEIISKFESIGDFTSNEPLDGEYLLAYSCQMAELYKKKEKESAEETDSAA